MADLVCEISAGFFYRKLKIYEASMYLLPFNPPSSVRTYDQFVELSDLIRTITDIASQLDREGGDGRRIIRLVPAIDVEYSETETFRKRDSVFPDYTYKPSDDFIRNIASELGYELQE